MHQRTQTTPLNRSKTITNITVLQLDHHRDRPAPLPPDLATLTKWHQKHKRWPQTDTATTDMTCRLADMTWAIADTTYRVVDMTYRTVDTMWVTADMKWPIADMTWSVMVIKCPQMGTIFRRMDTPRAAGVEPRTVRRNSPIVQRSSITTRGHCRGRGRSIGEFIYLYVFLKTFLVLWLSIKLKVRY